MPWWGFSALILALACSAGSFLVLRFSDGKSATQWPDLIAPNVCLSILGSVSTIALTFAIGEGIAIAWWRRAMKGASVKELHHAWSFSASVASIFIQLKSFNVIALAALTAKLSIVDGILFQRATTTYIDVDWHPVPATIDAWVSDSFPATATMGVHNDTDFRVYRSFASIVDEWYQRPNVPLFTDRSIPGCNGIGCTYPLAGMGFSFDCESNVLNDNFVNVAPTSSNATSSDITMFSVAVDILYPDETKNYSRLQVTTKTPYVDLDAGLAESASTCPTNFTVTTCEVRPAVLNYTIWYVQANSVEESRLKAVLKATNDPHHATPKKQDSVFSVSLGESGSLLGYSCGSIAANLAGVESESNEVGDCFDYVPKLRQQAGVEVLRNIDIHEPWTPGANSSLLGIYQTLKNVLESQATISYHNGTWYESATGLLAGIQSESTVTDGSCSYSYADPITSIILTTNTLTRQISIAKKLYGVEPGTTLSNVQAKGIQFFRDVYHSTDYVYAIAGVVCTAICVLLVVPVYWGFWQLGRDVTMGPLEIAYAFQGPAFAGVTDTNGHVSDLVKAVGDTRIKYAAVQDERGVKLAFKTT